jgi:hypothetical protein
MRRQPAEKPHVLVTSEPDLVKSRGEVFRGERVIFCDGARRVSNAELRTGKHAQ